MKGKSYKVYERLIKFENDEYWVVPYGVMQDDDGIWVTGCVMPWGEKRVHTWGGTKPDKIEEVLARTAQRRGWHEFPKNKPLECVYLGKDVDEDIKKMYRNGRA